MKLYSYRSLATIRWRRLTYLRWPYLTCNLGVYPNGTLDLPSLPRHVWSRNCPLRTNLTRDPTTASKPPDYPSYQALHRYDPPYRPNTTGNQMRTWIPLSRYTLTPLHVWLTVRWRVLRPDLIVPTNRRTVHRVDPLHALHPHFNPIDQLQNHASRCFITIHLLPLNRYPRRGDLGSYTVILFIIFTVIYYFVLYLSVFAINIGVIWWILSNDFNLSQVLYYNTTLNKSYFKYTSVFF